MAKWLKTKDLLPGIIETDEDGISYSDAVAITDGDHVWVGFLETSEEYGSTWRILEDDCLIDIDLDHIKGWMELPLSTMKFGDSYTVENFLELLDQ